MKEAALAKAVGPPQFISVSAPFSNFDYVDEHFAEDTAIRRLFSQARSRGVKTLIVEQIKPEGILLAENKEITRRYPDYRMTGLQRLSFWNRRIRTSAELILGRAPRSPLRKRPQGHRRKR